MVFSDCTHDSIYYRIFTEPAGPSSVTFSGFIKELKRKHYASHFKTRIRSSEKLKPALYSKQTM